jgi:hypothetical protein
MLAAFAQWLDQTGTTVFWVCIVGALTIDTVAVATVISTKSRELVNKWTGPVLVANALLLGGGTALPVAMRMTSAAVMAVAPSITPATGPAAEARADAQAIALDAPVGTAIGR